MCWWDSVLLPVILVIRSGSEVLSPFSSRRFRPSQRPAASPTRHDRRERGVGAAHAHLTHLFREPLLGILHVIREWVTEKSVPVEEPLPEDDLSEPTEYLSCHRGIPAGAASCPGCGWSYK